MEQLTLFDHQQEALEKTKDQNRVAYYLDMGLGKTFVGSEKMQELGTNKNMLICQKSKIDDWVDHFKTFYDYKIYNLRNKDDLKDFMEDETKCVGVINYELTFRRKELLKLKDFTLMLDESSMIQNEKTKRTKFVLDLDASNVILLSGTPTSGKYEKLYSQLKLLGWDISKRAFYQQFIIENKFFNRALGFYQRTVVGYKNVDRLKMKLREHGAVFMKTDDVMTLPDQIHNVVYCKPHSKYRKFMKEGIVEIKDGKQEIELIGDQTLTKRLYSRMLSSQYNNDKFDKLNDLIQSTEDRLIIFYNFTDELNKIITMIGDERPVSIVNGSVKDLEAYEEHDNSITLVQYQAGAMGLNLQKSNKIIYFSLPERSELFEQSKKRTHRIGQSKSCFYYYMVTTGSIEEVIMDNLKYRRDLTDELFREYERGFE